MAAARTVPAEVLGILGAAVCSGPTLSLIGRIDHKVYRAVNDVIESVGGKWSRKAQAHVFQGDAGEAIEPILLTGTVTSIRQEFGQFDSPPPVVERIMEIARVEPRMRVIEPSAGIGNIAVAASAVGADVMCVEIDPKRVQALKDHGLSSIIHADFLSLDGLGPFDRILMNPPFAPAQADIDHVLHAAKFLRPGGRLVAVMSLGAMQRENRKAIEFRRFVEDRDGEITPMPAGSFAHAGTQVLTCIATLEA